MIYLSTSAHMLSTNMTWYTQVSASAALARCQPSLTGVDTHTVCTVDLSYRLPGGIMVVPGLCGDDFELSSHTTYSTTTVSPAF